MSAFPMNKTRLRGFQESAVETASRRTKPACAGFKNRRLKPRLDEQNPPARV
jgi:hypothetical protein